MQAGINPSNACLWRRRGHTLVELLGATAIASLLVMIVAQFYIATNSAISMLYAEATLQTQMGSAERYILRDVRESKFYLGNPDCATFQLNGSTCGQWTPSAQRLVLLVPMLNASGEVITDGTNTDIMKYEYDPTNYQVTRVVSPYTGVSQRPVSMTPKVVANHIDSMSCVWEPSPGTPNHVHCDFTGSYQGSRGPAYHYQLAFRVRPRT